MASAPLTAREPYPISLTCPSRIVTRRSMRAARSMLCVATRAASPLALTSCGKGAEHMIGGLRVEIAGRLVRQQHPRAIGDRARDGDALLLAAGQFRRAMGLALTQDRDKRGVRARGPRPARAKGLRSSAAGRDSRAPKTPAADDGTGRRSRSPCASAPSACRRSWSRSRRRRSSLRRRPAAPSRPARWRSVDLPAPDGATSATDWPGESSRVAPLKTSTVVSPRP